MATGTGTGELLMRLRSRSVQSRSPPNRSNTNFAGPPLAHVLDDVQPEVVRVVQCSVVLVRLEPDIGSACTRTERLQLNDAVAAHQISNRILVTGVAARPAFSGFTIDDESDGSLLDLVIRAEKVSLRVPSWRP